MTTIAYVNGVVASDSRITKGNTICQYEAQKVFEGEKVVVAIAGSYAVCLRVVDWVLAGERTAERPDLSDSIDHGISVLVVDKDTQECWEYECVNLRPIPSQAPVTLGSGATEALAAMLTMDKLGLDMSAVLAVDIASGLDIYTDGNIQFIDMNPEEIKDAKEPTKKKSGKKATKKKSKKKT